MRRARSRHHTDTGGWRSVQSLEFDIDISIRAGTKY